MAGADNLIPQAHVLTVEDQSAGGKASGEARRRKRTMREAVQAYLDLPLKDADIDEVKCFEDLKRKGINVTMQDAIIIAQIKRAIEKQDLQSAMFLRDTAGDKPKDEQDVTITSGHKNAIADITAQMQTISDDDV